MRSHCKVHGFMDVFTETRKDCPYCEVERLKEELADSKQISSQAIGHQGSLLEAAQAKLSRYEGTVEVEGFTGKVYVGSCELHADLPKEFAQKRVTVLVMPNE